MLVSESKAERLAALLVQTGHGDAKAFRQLYTLTSVQLLKAALRSVWIREAAEEVLQESFIAIWRDAASWDPLESTCRHASLSIL